MELAHPHSRSRQQSSPARPRLLARGGMGGAALHAHRGGWGGPPRARTRGDRAELACAHGGRGRAPERARSRRQVQRSPVPAPAAKAPAASVTSKSKLDSENSINLTP